MKLRVIIHSLKSILRGSKLFNVWEFGKLKRNGSILPKAEMDNFLNTANKVLLSSVPKDIHVGLVQDLQNPSIQNYFAIRADWPKFERFLKNNEISYEFFDIRSSSWIDEAYKFDIIIWHSYSAPYTQEEAKSKIYFLEKYLRKICYPSYNELWSYEDKIRSSYLYTHLKIQSLPTFTTNSKLDALRFITEASFPIISKISTGSSSHGIVKIKDRRTACKYVNSSFSDAGRETYWPFIRQKNYVYFQEFVNDAKFDLRVIVVGNKLFGYYRYAKSGDFRASGAGIIEKKALPEEAMRIAVQTKNLIGSTSLAVDMLYSETDRKYYIIETSIFCGIDTAEQLVVDGKPGYYEYVNDSFIFKEGKFWIQELTLAEFFKSLGT